MTDMYDYLHNKKPDWWPSKIDGLLGKRGQITSMALKHLAYWELALIGFDDTEEQKAWMRIYSSGLEKHHEYMRAMEAKSQNEFIDEIIYRLEFRRSIKSGTASLL